VNPPSNEELSALKNDKYLGVLIVSLTLFVVIAMFFHPTGIPQSGSIPDLVHGGMIAFIALLFASMAYVSIRGGLTHPLLLFGLISYGISSIANIGAAMINGFVVPALVRQSTGAIDPDVFALSWEANQALANLAVYATGIAYIFWATNMITKSGADRKVVALFGFLAGVLPIYLLVFGVVQMDMTGATLIYGLHMSWILFVGIQLQRGRLL